MTRERNWQLMNTGNYSAYRICEIQDQGSDGQTDATLVVFDIELDWRRHRIKRASQDIHLSTLDLRLLRFLMMEPSRVFSRDEILKGVWPHGINVGLRTVDVHIAALRKALGTPSAPNPVRTVRGRGYSLDPGDRTSPALPPSIRPEQRLADAVREQVVERQVDLHRDANAASG